MANSGSGIKSLGGCDCVKTIRDILYIVFGKKTELKPVAGYLGVGRRIDS